METTELNNQFQSLVNGNNNTAGTNKKERMQVAKEIIKLFPEELKVRIKDHEIVLQANYSRAGNLNCYYGEIPVTLYNEFFNGFGLPKVNPESYLSINGDMSAQMSTNSKGGFYQKIKNKDIEII